MEGSYNKAYNPRNVSGIGGWLWIPIIWVGVALFSYASFLDMFRGRHSFIAARLEEGDVLPEWFVGLFYITGGYSLLMFCVYGVSTFLLMYKHYLFRQIMIFCFGAEALVSLIVGVVLLIYGNELETALDTELSKGRFLFNVGFALVWMGYFVESDRVKNTFRKERRKNSTIANRL